MRLELSPSRALAAAIVAAHAAAAGCLAAALPGASGFALAGLAVALGLAAARDRALLRGRTAPRALLIGAGGEARLEQADGASAPAAAVGGGGVTRHWVALRVRGALRRGFLVTGGMLGAEDFRRLRLWALWGRLPGGSSRGPA